MKTVGSYQLAVGVYYISNPVHDSRFRLMPHVIGSTVNKIICLNRINAKCADHTDYLATVVSAMIDRLHNDISKRQIKSNTFPGHEINPGTG
jgi:hypothetical protein